MKLSLFNEDKNVLLVGEGNFSFAVTLVKNNVNIHITATCFEKDVNETGKKNIDILRNHGVRVFMGVDATCLENHAILCLESFDLIVFNFPHVGGKMRIEKNRELLKKFFLSVTSVLQTNGEVFVSLCDGQGGTPADKCIRHWNDSWQIVEMAAHGGFILFDVEPFDSSLFETYTVTGYRSLDKKFNTKGSLTHIFKLMDKPNAKNIAIQKRISFKDFYEKAIDWKDIVFLVKTQDASDMNNNLSLYSNTYKFDITFSITSEFHCVKLYEILYNYACFIIDNVEYIGSYIFPNLKETRTFRITYKSKKFPLHRKLVIDIHNNIIAEVIEKGLNVIVSR